MRSPVQTRYAHIARELATTIGTGGYPVGSVLPTENQLAEQFGVSRATVRAALSELQQLGLVSRRRNAGTRVEASRPVREGSEYQQSLGTVDDVLQYAGATERRVQTIMDEVADDELAKRLGCRPGRRWLRISSLRMTAPGANAEPICWTDVYVDGAYAAEIRASVMNYHGAIASLIEERTGRTVAAILQEIRAVGAPAGIAEALRTAPNAHALEITRRYEDSAGDTFVISISVHRADRFTYFSRLKRQRRP
jgi:GntR family transcriptional regulator